MSSTIRVIVTGASGRMGKEVIKAVSGAEGMRVVGAVDMRGAGQDAGLLAAIGPLGIPVRPDLSEVIDDSAPDVMVDFTVADAAVSNMMTAIEKGVRFVVGTSGIPAASCERIVRAASDRGVGGVIVPNFAIGAVLMMRFARMAAKYMPSCEIVELHHDGKVDFPSGTARATAVDVASARSDWNPSARPGASGRGVSVEGVPIHSVRLPGLVAHQEVIFGGQGQVLTIRHDSMGRDSFMPGVLLAVRRVITLDRVITGLDPLLD
ncbi:MAG: 4-hydroxy-tetrahydrodipicolinate reductase [Firmicutes bacterium]|nr:4-hydroxy-tetrahydrodipicolinate reductase [Bacillota bacterium]